MKRRINLIDAIYSNEGHYIDDAEKYTYLNKDFDVHYFVNGSFSNEARLRLQGINLHECPHEISWLGNLKFLFSILPQINAKDFNLFLSAKYTPLFIFSLASSFYSYFLLVHFFPTTKILLNRFLLRCFQRKCHGLFALDDFLREDICQQTSRREKIEIIHSRDLSIPTGISRGKKVVVSFLGAMNRFKDVTQIMELINEHYYPHLEFRFYSKGILEFSPPLATKNSVEIQDRYLGHEEYEALLRQSDYVYLSYLPGYGVRYSGLMVDALGSGCSVICNSNPSFTYFIRKYHAGISFCTKEELHTILATLGRPRPISDQIYLDYSKERREGLLKKQLAEYFGQGLD